MLLATLTWIPNSLYRVATSEYLRRSGTAEICLITQTIETKIPAFNQDELDRVGVRVGNSAVTPEIGILTTFTMESSYEVRSVGFSEKHIKDELDTILIELMRRDTLLVGTSVLRKGICNIHKVDG